VSSRADALRWLCTAAARAAASVALGLLGQVLVLGCDRVPILPPTEATPARLHSQCTEGFDELAARWRRAVARRPTAARADVDAVDARVTALDARGRAGVAHAARDPPAARTILARREP
jgi:hypothetical protein